MRKIRITWQWRDYSEYYQIDDGEKPSNLEMVVLELNSEYEPKTDQDDHLLDEYKKVLTEDMFEIYRAFDEAEETEYKGHTIKRVIDKSEYEDSERVSYQQVENKLVSAVVWVRDFIARYQEGFSVEPIKTGDDAVQALQLTNNNLENPHKFSATFLRGLFVEILKL